DRRIQEWIDKQSTAMPVLNDLSKWSGVVGTLPTVTAVTAALAAWLWGRRRSGREVAAAIRALGASEAIRLMLFGLLRSRDVELNRALTWPYGFAGLLPLRAMAVYGMAASLVRAQDRKAGISAGLLAASLILLADFGVVWSQGQEFTEVLLEY